MSNDDIRPNLEDLFGNSTQSSTPGRRDDGSARVRTMFYIKASSAKVIRTRVNRLRKQITEDPVATIKHCHYDIGGRYQNIAYVVIDYESPNPPDDFYLAYNAVIAREIPPHDLDKVLLAEHFVRHKQRKGAEDIFKIDWETATVWSTESDDFLIIEMEDAFLWQTVNWTIRNSVDLHRSAVATGEYDAPSPRSNPLLAAYAWLRDRTVFRAMVKEAIRRDLTFPPDAHRFLKEYVLDNAGSIDGYVPWRDPASLEQAKELKPLMNMPTVPTEIEYGKSARRLDLRDN